ncbi:hypothetical protein [Mesorhizobium carmichaelinearum]|nr:hypothetical protein [Mesorhizobium carmichaelinearum]
MPTTKDKQKALDMAKEIGDKVRVEAITRFGCCSADRYCRDN